MGLGPLPFLMISEFTGHDVVATAQSLGTVMNWFKYVYSDIVPISNKYFGYWNGILGFVINSLVYGFDSTIMFQKLKVSPILVTYGEHFHRFCIM